MFDGLVANGSVLCASSWSFQLVNVSSSACAPQFWDNSWAGVLSKARRVAPVCDRARTVLGFKAGCMLSQRVGTGQDTQKNHSIPLYSLLVLCFEDIFYRFVHLLLILPFISCLFRW